MTRRLPLILLASLLASCGSNNASDDGGVPGDGGQDAGADAITPVEGAITVQWGPYDVPPGMEETRCVVRNLGNANAFNAHEIHNVLGATSHHFIVYRLNNATEEILEPFSCQPFLDTLDPNNGAPLMITQKKDDRLTLPDGVAYALNPNQFVRLEMHFINVTTETQELTATSTFMPIPDAEFEAAADILFMGSGDINIPAHSEHTVGPTFIRAPGNLSEANFFAITGHEHQWGTNVTVEAGTLGGDMTPVYAPVNFDWGEPETIRHDPPFQLPEGGGFNITCDYNNLSNSSVSFGTGVDDEMCFFWAYYYPSQGSVVCINDVFGFDLCCPGSPLCGFAGGIDL